MSYEESGAAPATTAEAPIGNQAALASHEGAAAEVRSEGAAGSETGSTAENSGAIGLPPDVVASVSDTLVSPGDAVEVIVRGTPDVEQVLLWDGMGDRQALVYDESARTWSVTYRVPLRASIGRLGISLTATNGAGRWCRVWLFVTNAAEMPAKEGEGPVTP
jgi:hypothetical protein